MKKYFLYIIFTINIAFAKDIPRDFVDVKKEVPSIKVDIRYATDFNFVGKKISGYKEDKCYLTKQAAQALKKVQGQLILFVLSLKVYDCYRPQKAVDEFVRWAAQIKNNKMKETFYKNVSKKNLFKDGYIAAKSGHSRGSTVDLTIVPLDSEIPKHRVKQVSCEADYIRRDPDNSLDFGTGFDCFSLKSHPDYKNISPQAKANRFLLQKLMKDAGFKPTDTEWWHFTLVKEPYRDTYFDFDI